MSESPEQLREEAGKYFQETLTLMQNGQPEKALESLQKAEEAAQKAKANDILIHTLNIRGQLMLTLGALDEVLRVCGFASNFFAEILSKDPENKFFQRSLQMNLNNIDTAGNLYSKACHFPEAKKSYELGLKVSQKLLNSNPDNKFCQIYVGNILGTLGTLLIRDMGRIEEAKQRYEKALEIYEELLKTDPENVTYQSDVGTMLNNLGNLLSDMGRIEEAKQRYEKALEIYEKLLKTNPENVTYQSYVGTTLNNLGTLLRNMGRIEEAKQRYEKALEMREKLLENDPKNVAYQSYVGTTLNNLGNLLSDMGRMEEAKQRYEKALQIYEKLLKTDTENVTHQSDVAMMLNNLGNLLSNMGRIEEAKQRYEKALEIYEKLFKNDPENIAYQSYFGGALNNLGNLLKNMGRIEEAKQRYEKALEMREKLLENDPKNVAYQSDVSMTLNNLGNLLKNMGRIEEAKQRYEKALKMREKLLEDDPKNVAYQSYVGTTLNNLGNLLKNMGRIEEAKQRYEKALEMREKLLKNDPENVAYQSYVGGALNNLGILFSDMGRIEEAKQGYEKALEFHEKLLKNDPKNVAYQSYVGKTLNNLGTLLSDMRHIEGAKQEYEKALEMREKLLKNDPENVAYQSDVAVTLNNLGNLLKNMGLIEEAKLRYEKALEMREKLLKNDPENVAYQSDVAVTLNNVGNLLHKEENYSTALNFHSRALNYASNSPNLEQVFKIYGSMGRCFEKLGYYDKSFTKYKESIECIESLRSQVSTEEIKMDIMWNKSSMYTDMVSLLYTRMNDSEKAWEYLGRFKSRTLLDSLRLLEFEAPERVPKELLTQEENLLASIRIFNRQIRKLEKADETTQLTRKIKEKESELNEIYERIREFSPEYVDLRKGQPLGIKEIKELIGKQNRKTAFVEYYTTAEKVYIFVMRSDEKNAKIEIVDLSSDKLSDYIYSYHMEIVEIPGIEETWQELSGKLIEPIFSYIDGCELVYLIPHGLLHYLPLHALLVKDKHFEKKKRLIEYFPIVYVPNLTALKYAQGKNYQCLKPCLSLGYTPHEYQKELFEGEAILVAEQFNVEPILGDQAKSNILENVSSNVIHASCHGEFNPTEPLNSGLCLKDGMLTAREIFEMEIKTNLLVLSACQTGLNSPKPGDDLVGLTRAFLYAGTRSLIVSLWSVEAKSTYEYMKNFYQVVKKGENKAKALQKIQVDFINGKYGDTYTHPYFWAPFVLIGDWK